MSKIFIPAMKPEDWKQFLAKEKHWKPGHSAWAIAHCWHKNPDDFPDSVKRVFRESCLPLFGSVQLLFAFPEYKVSLPPTKGRASQNDLLVVGKGEGQLVSIAVEGKVSEPFDKPVCEWITKDSQGKKLRLSFLCNQLGLQADQVPERGYKLLHRTVSAILMARELGARSALMLVHSFSPQNEHFDDYGAFAALYGIEAHPDALYFAKELGGVNLYLGWVKGDSRYLTMEP
ncbi:MAG: hypothetical protein Q8Q12_10555 [bacterium]|nr:hypothetical protein [bacterium]